MSFLYYYLMSTLAAVVLITLYGWIRAFVSLKLGDDSVDVRNRLTFNPMEHIDPMGIVLMIFFDLGFVRPMRNSRINFKRRKLDYVLVAVLPGIIITLISTAFFYLMVNLKFVYGMFFASMMLGKAVMMFVYNLIPLYPLDGEKILIAYGSPNLKMKMDQYSNIMMMVLLFLTFLGVTTGFVSMFANAILNVLLV